MLGSNVITSTTGPSETLVVPMPSNDAKVLTRSFTIVPARLVTNACSKVPVSVMSTALPASVNDNCRVVEAAVMTKYSIVPLKPPQMAPCAWALTLTFLPFVSPCAAAVVRVLVEALAV